MGTRIEKVEFPFNLRDGRRDVVEIAPGLHRKDRRYWFLLRRLDREHACRALGSGSRSGSAVLWWSPRPRGHSELSVSPYY